MCGIMLGNLSIEQIERDYGFTFTDDERKRLRETHHPVAKFEDGEAGWHMFDMPPFLVVSRGPIGLEILDIFMRHSGEMTGSFRGGHPPCSERGSDEDRGRA